MIFVQANYLRYDGMEERRKEARRRIERKRQRRRAADFDYKIDEERYVNRHNYYEADDYVPNEEREESIEGGEDMDDWKQRELTEQKRYIKHHRNYDEDYDNNNFNNEEKYGNLDFNESRDNKRLFSKKNNHKYASLTELQNETVPTSSLIQSSVLSGHAVANNPTGIQALFPNTWAGYLQAFAIGFGAIIILSLMCCGFRAIIVKTKKKKMKKNANVMLESDKGAGDYDISNGDWEDIRVQQKKPQIIVTSSTGTEGVLVPIKKASAEEEKLNISNTKDLTESEITAIEVENAATKIKEESKKKERKKKKKKIENKENDTGAAAFGGVFQSIFGDGKVKKKSNTHKQHKNKNEEQSISASAWGLLSNLGVVLGEDENDANENEKKKAAKKDDKNQTEKQSKKKKKHKLRKTIQSARTVKLGK